MNKTAPQEQLLPIFATHNELIAVNAAVSHYNTWLVRSPEAAKEYQDVIKLLDTFQRRLVADTTGPGRER